MEQRAWMLYDCNAMLGQSNESQGISFPDAAAFLRHMERYGIDKSLVYDSIAKYYNAVIGNEMLVKRIEGAEQLRPVFVVTPGDTGEFWDVQTLKEKLCAHRVAGVRLCPLVNSDGMKLESFSLKPWSVGEYMALFNEMRMPVFLDMDIAHWSEPIPWDDIAELCERYPDVPIIVTRVGCGDNRYLFPMMKRYKNLYFEISYFAAHLGLEGIRNRFGVKQMLLGTDAPVHAPSCPIGMLYYSELTEEEKADVAGGNLERLIGGIRYDG